MIIGPVYSLAIALSLGMLIGLERGWQARERPEGQRVAGIRTYALIGLLGGVCALEPGAYWRCGASPWRRQRRRRRRSYSWPASRPYMLGCAPSAGQNCAAFWCWCL